MNELKPCPFCGGEAKFFSKATTARGIIQGWGFGIYCTQCDVTTSKTTYRVEVELTGTGDIMARVDERPEAIKAWNMRVNDGKAPAVDAVEVVRCKDCKHKGWIQEPCHGKSVDFCNVFDSTINNPGKCFCYYGERRKNEAD